MKNEKVEWGSKVGFILAAVGSTVGLGNIWKFPGKAYAGGGGIYLITYFLIVLIIGIPFMITELSLGRHTKKNTVGIFRVLDKRFVCVGFFGVICAFLIYCYYSHIGGWVLSYVVSYITEGTKVMNGGMNYFFNLLGYDATTGETWFPYTAIIFALIFVVLNAFIVIKGVSSGIEKFNKIGMPALFILLIVLLIRAVTLEGAGEGVKYLLTFDLNNLTSGTLVSALGQAFYSLSLGMAIMTTYGAYLSDKESITKNTTLICVLDTFIAFMAGFIIVPSVFATLGADYVGKGGSFAFGVLGAVFNGMPFGTFFGFLFYLLLFFAALSSSTSILEGVVSFTCEEFKVERKKAIIVISIISFLIGIIYTISQASMDIKLPWIDFTGFHMFAAGDWLECLTDRLILPLCALGEAIYVGWIWGPHNIIDEASKEGNAFSMKRVYSFLIKYICPLAIISIILVSFITGTTIS